MAGESNAPWTLRQEVSPGDLGHLVWLHGTVYAREYGFDPTFEAYVAGPIAEVVRNRSERDRLWIAESGGRIVGCVAIVGAGPSEAQVRWYLVVPEMRGRGLGRALLSEALGFAASSGYEKVFLWTVSALTAAARLYREFGFAKVEERRPERLWGAEVLEERYEAHVAPRAQPSGA